MNRDTLRILALTTCGLALSTANCAGEGGDGTSRDSFFFDASTAPSELGAEERRLDGLFDGSVARDDGEPAADFDVEIARAAQVADYSFPATWSAMSARRKAATKGETTRESKTWKRAQSVPNSSSLFVGDDEKLPLEAVQASVRVDGFRARVVLDCLYRNDRDTQLEGTFKLRLPDGATPYFFAFGETRVEATGASDVQAMFIPPEAMAAAANAPAAIMEIREQRWSRPREARIVPREKAAHAYGDVVRRRIDPALMEWAGAGVFSSRVFPLVPGRLHRIVIGYDVDLVATGGELEYRLDLPGDAAQTDVSIDVSSDVGDAARVTPAATASIRAGRRLFHLRNPDARTITVRVPDSAGMLVGTDGETGGYFAASLRPDVPQAADAASAGSTNAVFLVDVSLSSNPERFGTWLTLLRAILDRNRDSIANFAVLYFNVENFAWKEHLSANTPQAVDEVLAFSDRLSLEGATDLGAVLATVARPDFLGGAPHDLFLLSDGAPTWGEDDLQAISERLAGGATRALYAYRTGFAGTDARTLGHLARETGGAVFSVVGESEVAAAAVAHRARPWRIRDVSVAGGSDLLVAGRPTSLFPGQRVKLVGRGTPTSGTDVVLELEQDGRRHTARMRVAPVFSELAARAYGEVAVTQIEDLAAEAEAQARAYATHFRVVGKTCSLLMLETEADYQQYGIVPQEDAYVVKSRPVGPVIAEHVARRRRERADGKTGTLAWLRRLSDIPGGKFELPAALEVAIERMPAAAFEVRTRPLECRLRSWSDVPGAVQEELVARDLAYDSIAAEAVRRKDASGPADALRVLSSLVEQSPGDTALARDVGFSALEWGLPDHAYHLFRRVARARPYEPQTYRALARTLESMGRTDLAILNYEVAVGGEWDARFGEFRQIAAIDYMRLLRRIADGQASKSVPGYAAARLRTLAASAGIRDPDLLVAITWNTDRTDVDLHVTDPNGEECDYQHRQTEMGGELTQDVTLGYGPEMFVLPDAVPGEYRVEVVYYSSDRNRASLRTKVQCIVIERWGTARERATETVVELRGKKQRLEVLRVSVER